MGQNSSIEWTHHTHNIVWGCQRVSEGCTHCYAETLAKRYGYSVWGPAKTTERRTMSARYWAQPLRWNDDAYKAQERRRVFCGSMSDIFEDHPTNERERARLWPLIEQTPMLDWLLLTKRPENMIGMASARRPAAGCSMGAHGMSSRARLTQRLCYDRVCHNRCVSIEGGDARDDTR